MRKLTRTFAQACSRLRKPGRKTTILLGAVFVALLIEASGVGAGAPTGRVAARVGKPSAPVSLTSAASRPIVGHSVKNDTSPALRTMPQIAPRPTREHEVNINPSIYKASSHKPDAALQTRQFKNNMPSPTLNFDGIGFPGVNCSCAPPDTDGEVGSTQYVQIVNSGFQVFNKTTGASVFGPASIDSVWAGFGGVCESGSGDPVALYDQIANRWLISQFAGAGSPTDECVAVSTSDDATGSWNRYDFHLGPNFYDYPKLSVWPDAYYMTTNVFNSAGTAFFGPEPWALDRTAMLNGDPATFITFTDPAYYNPGADAILPADLDGSNMPPAGAPDPFLELGTDTSSWPLWRFHVDFATPANSTFTLGTDLTPAAYSVLCGGCVPQGGTTSLLDTLSDRGMFRLAYRRFGDGHEALVGNMSVAANGAAGVRWFEITNATSGTASFVQQSTYAPTDGVWRWMGGAAMDQFGDIAVGYSASSAAIHPEIRWAGRLAGDPLNTLGQGEAIVFQGTGSQTQTNSRWGDYSDMTIDPVDDCTFWYTTEYYATTGSFNWRTRIASFKFPSCTTTGGTMDGTVTDQSTGDPVAGAHLDISDGTQATTDAAGHYSLTMPPATYSITFSHPGYADQTVNNIVVNQGQTTTTDVQLVPAADLSITKTADNANADIGGQIGYTVTLTNAGSPQANGVAVTDSLPAGPDINWTLAGDSDSGWAVVGSPPNQTLTGPSTVAGSGSSTGHVVSSTFTSSGGTYNNTASFTSSGAGSGSDSASIVLADHYDVTTQTGQSIVPGTTDTGNHCDDCTTAVTLPFTVHVYGRSFTSGRVSSNGNFMFGSTNASGDYLNGCLPDSAHGADVFLLWDDLVTNAGGGGIFSLTTGSAPHRTYYLEWRAQHYAGGNAEAELVLHEDSDVINVIYGDVGDASSSTEGIQDYTVPVWDEFGCNGNGDTPSSGLEVTYTPSGGPPPPPPPPPVKPPCTVPNVVGKTLASAKAKIRARHCRVGNITHKVSSRRLKNHVLKQSPRAGRRFANGHKVNLTVGKGPRR